LKIVILLAAIVVVLAILTLGISFPVRSSYASKAKLIQRVEKSTGDDLFGDNGTVIGSPQMLIIEDEKAFLGPVKPGEPLSVDEKYLKDHNVYPLQLKTVDFFINYIRLSTGMSLIIAIIAYALASRRLKSATTITVVQS